MPPGAPKPRPFTPRQQAQNRAFLDALRRTGNVRLACRELRVHRATYTKRRAKCAAFATLWDMALAAASAAFRLAGGPRMPEAPRPQDLRTKGGEPTIVRLANGRLQLRRAPPGRMTDAAERVYLAALASSANVRLAAAAAGFAHSTFYSRRRIWVGFGALMGQALRVGYDRLEYVVMERTLQAIHGAQPEQGWLGAAIRDNPLPPFSFDQAFQILCLHRNTVRLDGMRPPGRPSKVAPTPAQAMFAIGRNIDALQRAGHYEAKGSWTLPGEPEGRALPPLDLVTGQGATLRVTYHPGRALFGGWRIDDWKARKKTR